MTIDNDILQSHRELGPTSVRFLQFVENRPQTLDRAHFQKIYDFKVDLVFPQAWPCFIDQQMRSRLEKTGRDVFQLIKSIPQRLFGNDPVKISRYFHYPVDEVEDQLAGVTPRHLNDIMGRADLVFTEDGFKCLEYNVSASVGGWSINFLEPVYKSVPLIDEFIRQNSLKFCNKGLFNVLFNHMMDAAADKFQQPVQLNTAVTLPGYGEHSNVVLKQMPVDEIYQEVLSKRFPGVDGDIRLGSLADLNFKDDELYFKDQHMQILLEMNLGSVTSEVVQAFKAQKFLMYDGPIAILLSNKLNIALLSEHQQSDLFSENEREIIRRCIPWTRKMIPGETSREGQNVDLEKYILAHREQLVIKPAGGLGGDNVYVGPYTPAPLWREVVKIAFRKKDWLVQEFVQSKPFLFQTNPHGCAGHDVIWGVFVFGEHYAGTFLRVLSRNKTHKGVINSHQGAEYSVVLEVDE